MSRLYPSKNLGQNFLNSRHYAARIVEFANIKNDVVIEIGAGKGALTKYLSDAAGVLYAVEIDRRLLGELRRTASSNTIILNRDFLAVDPADFEDPVIVGNIPYPLSTQIFEKLAFDSDKFKRAVITVQKEFYDRMVAATGSARYGPLSLMSAYFFKVTKGFEIPGRFFRPSPKVLSIVVALERKRDRHSIEDEPGFFSFLKDCFRQRRKSMNKHVAAGIARDILGASNPRPQELSLDQWIEIYAARVNGFAGK